MKKITVLGLMVTTMVLGAGVLAHESVQAVSDEDFCLSEAFCLDAFKQIAASETPSFNAERADCPGQVTCPLTGELVCKDRCPLTSSVDEIVESDVPACCEKPE